jgi:cell volume regulation protein A
LIHKKTILKVYDGLAWLMQIVLFLTLGLLVFPNQIIPFFITGLIISLTLILLARPLAVLLSLSFFKMPMRNKLFISWVGLRGAVPIVFATYPMIAGLERSNDIFHLVFFISVSSLLIQGTTISKIAKWLKVSLLEKVKLLSETDKFILELPKSSLKEFVIFSNDFAHNKRIVDLKLPISSFIVMILRDGQYIRPGGSTLLQSGDKLMILADRPEDFKKVEKILKLGPDTF